MINYDEYYARVSYDRLVLHQPHISFKGLYYANGQYIVVCSFEEGIPRTLEGELLSDWLEKYRILGTPPLQLISEIPDSAVEVPLRTIEEISLCVGEPLNLLDIERLLLLQLPHDFPFFSMESRPPKLIFKVERDLTEEESTLLIMAHDTYHSILEPVIIVDKQIPKKSPYTKINRVMGHTLDLLNSRYIAIHHPDSSSLVKNAVEQDEDFWVDTSHDLFCKNIQEPSLLTPSAFNISDSACYIDASVQRPKNIRSYLTLFQRIIISPPLDDNVENALSGLNITKDELLRLVEKGKIQIVVPQSIDRYNLDLITSILEANPNGVMMSRRLAAISVAGIRKRMPLLYPPLGAMERSALLKVISQVSDNQTNCLFTALRGKLGESWLSMVSNLNARGAMAISSHGIAPILSDMLEQIHGVDRFLEIFFSTAPLEWAMGLNATLIPNGTLQDNYVNMAARFYSPVGAKEKILPNADLDTLLTDLYMLDNDCAISEIEPFCKKSITERFLSIVQSTPEADIEARIKVEVERINAEILQYESNKKRLAKYELLGSFLALGSWKLPTGYETLNYIPIALFVAGALFNHDHILPQNVCDWLRSIATLTPKDSIFIGRVRKE